MLRILLASWVVLIGVCVATAKEPPVSQDSEEGVSVFQTASQGTFEVHINPRWDEQAWALSSDSYGAGIGFRRDGWILTTAHQLDDAKTISVTCPDGVTRDADIWLSLKNVDIGLVHVPDYDVPVLPHAPSRELRVGQTIYVLGHPKRWNHSLRRGIVSGLHRVLVEDGKLTDLLQDFIQIDAEANPGNSGGPLLDARGRVIGMVCASASAVSGKLPGLSFALPIDEVRLFAERLIEERESFRAGGIRFLGNVCVVRLVPKRVREKYEIRATHGLAVGRLNEGGKKLGLQTGDVVTALDGVPIHHWMQARVLLGTRKPGSTVAVRLERRGEPLELTAPITTLTK